MNDHTLAPLLLSLYTKSGSEAVLQYQSFFPGNRLVGGKYHLGTHTVTLYIEVIKQQCLQLFGTLERLQDYALVVLAHELGHAEDDELPLLADQLEAAATQLERDRTALKIEENAWRFAKELLTDIEPAFFDEVAEQSLFSYRTAINLQTA
ncbi:hypothetical protein GJU40_17375 [Bacillus lacus]|uniref:Uncharacterized protein n=1 Tax=Metabacillus lacus TaxID=1983721 RepID=A0A7X2M1A2_9BACI|nr:hypothetical protein [Metabacillus lacus]MRX73909.1 hypothetical protein [Metabacillus lacus]